MTKHTPGPWHKDEEPYHEYIWGPRGEMIAELRGEGAGLPKKANAHLISAAPELYETLKAVYDAYMIGTSEKTFIAAMQDFMTDAELALKKARGL